MAKKQSNGPTPDEKKELVGFYKTKHIENNIESGLMDVTGPMVHTRTAKVIRPTIKNIVHKVLQKRVPFLEEIADLSLSAVVARLRDLKDPEKREKMLATTTDILNLSKIAQNMNAMLRLETGQSTSNVSLSAQMSLDQTLTIFKELQSKDKVFEYPLLEEDDEDIKLITDGSN